MHGRAEELGFLRRNSSIRHAGKLFLQRLVYGLHPVMKIAYKRLRLQDAVHKPIAVAVAERTDAGIQYAIYRTEVHRDNLSLVLIQLTKRPGRKTNLGAVLYQRKKQVALRRTLDTPFRRRSEDTAATHPRFIVIFLKGKNPDAGIVWLDIRIVWMFETAEGTACLNHFFVKTLNLAFEQLVRI